MNEVEFYFTYLFCTYFPPKKYELWIFEIYEIASEHFKAFETLEPNEKLSLYDDICDFLQKREEEIEVDLQMKTIKNSKL